MKIYILEDDHELASLMRLWLQEANHTIHIYDSGRELILALQSNTPDLVVLDWNVPELSGLDVMRWMKSNGQTEIPILFTSTRSSEEEVVEALTIGADDYLVKPVKQGEFLARIGAVMRRYKTTEKTRDTHPYTFDEKLNLIYVGDVAVEMTEKEFQLAKYLFGNQGQIVARDVLLESIWSRSAELSTRTVDTHISRLRKKLNLNGDTGWQLKSIYHKGYRLIKL